MRLVAVLIRLLLPTRAFVNRHSSILFKDAKVRSNLALVCISLLVPACQTAVPKVTSDNAFSIAEEAYSDERFIAAARAYQSVIDMEDASNRAKRSAAYGVAYSYARSDGKQSLALDWLERAVSLGFVDIEHMAADQDLDSIRDDPRYAEIIALAEKKLVESNRRWAGEAFQTDYQPELPVEERLAGLSVVWSEVKYNFANFDLVPDLDWDAEYLKMIPRVIATEDTHSYYRLLQAFIAKLEDGHSNVYFPRAKAFHSGQSSLQHVPAISYSWIENKLLLDHVPGEEFKAKGIMRGDEIVAINGEAITAYADRERRPFVSGSIKANIDTVVYSWRLMTGAKGPVSFTIRKRDGEIVTVKSSRPDWPEYRRLMGDIGQLPPNFQWTMLDNEIAYVELNSFGNDEAAQGFADNFEALSQANGIVIDVRQNGGGSDSVGYAVLSRLTDQPYRINSAWTLDYKPTYRAWGELTGRHEWPENYQQPHGQQHYTGPVAVLSGPKSFSAAENFLMAFDIMDRGPIIGTPSGGSTGQPLAFDLPGGGWGRVTTKRDHYPDGSDFVSVGVQPDILAPMTVGAFRDKRDPALEKAVEYVLLE
ncbi:MAG: S41 family peptidase [Pseudomonadota bacterium]